jgi:hypothetical protein
VGMRPTESGTATPSSDPHPDRHPDRTARAESRRALRAQRRKRRRIAIGCAVLVTLCVLITLVIVDIARDRTSAPQSVGPLTQSAVVHNDLLSASSTRPPIPPAPRRQ